jgi:hypothetical protein
LDLPLELIAGLPVHGTMNKRSRVQPCTGNLHLCPEMSDWVDLTVLGTWTVSGAPTLWKNQIIESFWNGFSYHTRRHGNNLPK